jgi:hypothetical protein
VTLSKRILQDNIVLACNNLLGQSGIETLFLLKNVQVLYIEHVPQCDNL